MEIELSKNVKPEDVASKAMFLAYKASRVVGMGHFQAREGVTESDVWEAVTDVGNLARADYVFGRMMKLTLRWTKNAISFPDGDCAHDYQSWCLKYPTFENLVRHAIQDVESQAQVA